VFTYPLEVQLTRITGLVGVYQFAVAGPPGVYTILASPDLANWNELGVATNQFGEIGFTDETAPLSPLKFYRAQALP
jgi:hypothetical protein